ncbi:MULTISPECIES: hypothetical protein [unclassified Nostoc]|nr:hypothetical protein [Nostoc sp. S13]MDF5738711.1 hypothetical protein [Nostoc sp. S13]
MLPLTTKAYSGKGWEDMENYGLSKLDWLEEFFALPNGIPCPDTF